jgi:alcohol dehydrogenase
LSILGSRNALPADFGRIINLIEDGVINTDPWITHRTSLGDMIGNFDSYTNPDSGVIKAIVEVT